MARILPEPASKVRPTILIVDDEAVVRSAFQLYFETVGYQVSVAEGGEKALEILRSRQGTLDVVLLDLVMPGMHGIDVLRRLKEIDSSVEVIIATGCGSMTSAIEALRHGAYDYITKPVINLEEDLLTVVRGALASRNGKLLEGAADSTSFESEARPAREKREIELYRAVDALARDTLAIDQDQHGGALTALGEVLTGHLDARAGVAVSRGADGRLTCLARWNAFEGLAEGPLLDVVAFLWQSLQASPERWVPVEAGSIDVPGLTPKSIDSLLIRLPLVTEKALGGAGADGAALIVLRSPAAADVSSPPGTALLALAASEVLARMEESCVAARGR